MLDYTVSIDRLLRARLYRVYRKVIACQIILCLLKVYCVLYYIVSNETFIACYIILCQLKGYCVLDYTVSIERFWRARL